MEEYLNLIDERQDYEDILYDLLITPLNLDSTFWDPVIVCLTEIQINNFKIINCECECIICKYDKDSFRNLSCCNHDICNDCIKDWFSISVFCPFCKKDQRC